MILWGDIKSEVQRELNLQDELFITATEMLDYGKNAIRVAEAEIHKLNIEDQYFEANTCLRLVAGVRDYSLPENIYGNKITRIIYSNGDLIYTIQRMTTLRRYEDAEYAARYGFTHPYEYMIMNNNKIVGARLRFYPTSFDSVGVYTTTCTTVVDSNVIAVASTTNLAVGQFVFADGVPENSTIVSISGLNVSISESATVSASGVAVDFVNPTVLLYYIREAFIPVDDDSPIDIPEFSNFIQQYVKVECIKKEKLNPMFSVENAKLMELQTQMVATLTNMVPDQADEIEKDWDIYRYSS